jgi:hypothetical protein
MKNAVFWDVAPCGYCICRRFGGKYRLHLHGTRKKEKIRERGTNPVDDYNSKFLVYAPVFCCTFVVLGESSHVSCAAVMCTTDVKKNFKIKKGKANFKILIPVSM